MLWMCFFGSISSVTHIVYAVHKFTDNLRPEGLGQLLFKEDGHVIVHFVQWHSAILTRRTSFNVMKRQHTNTW